MVLTVGQMAAFFMGDNGLAIPAQTVAQMANKGITTIDNLAEFDKDSVETLASTLCCGARGGPPLVFGAKSQLRIIVAGELVRHYESIGHTNTTASLHWTHVMKNFQIRWKSLIARKKDDDEPDVPKIGKGLLDMKWSESSMDTMHVLIGARKIPLAYVLRKNANAPAIAPNLATDQPHLAEAGSIEVKLILRASHNHPLFCNNNAAVYHKLEEASRGATFAASIKPFLRAKNGHGAYLALVGQHAGSKTSYWLYRSGADGAILLWKSMLLCTVMRTSRCKQQWSMSPTSCRVNTLVLGLCWTASKRLTPSSMLQWHQLRIMQTWLVLGLILKRWRRL